MNKRSRDDIIFDTILEQAFNDAAEARFNEIEKECPKDTQLSEKHKKIERKAYQRYTQRNRSVSLSSRLKPFHKVAACFVAVLLAGVIMVFSVPTVRADFCNLVISVFEKYISFGSVISDSVYSIETDEYIFKNIPVEYKQTDFDDFIGISYTFTNKVNDSYFTISYSPTNSTSIHHDNEHTSIVQHSITGNIAYLIKPENTDWIELIWNDGDNTFSILGNLSEKMILEIAKNIEKFK